MTGRISAVLPGNSLEPADGPLSFQGRHRDPAQARRADQRSQPGHRRGHRAGDGAARAVAAVADEEFGAVAGQLIRVDGGFGILDQQLHPMAEHFS